MATPNYAYEKRQRELIKKRKKEEKRKQKLKMKQGAEKNEQSGETGDERVP